MLGIDGVDDVLELHVSLDPGVNEGEGGVGAPTILMALESDALYLSTFFLFFSYFLVLLCELLFLIRVVMSFDD